MKKSIFFIALIGGIWSYAGCYQSLDANMDGGTDTDSEPPDTTIIDGDTEQSDDSDSGETDSESEKLDAGDLRWVRRAGGNSWDIGYSLAVDQNGSILITGKYSDQISFGQDQQNSITLTADSGSEDVFLAKYDAQGRLLWAKSAGSAGRDVGKSICVGLDNTIWIAGSFGKTATFGRGEKNETVLTPSNGEIDLFLAHYTPEGALIEAQAVFNANTETGVAMMVAPDGGVILTGRIYQEAVFAPGTTEETRIVSAGREDVFLAKFSANGRLRWVQQAGGEDHDLTQGIAVHPNGSILLTGFFRFEAVFGKGQPNETTLTLDSYQGDSFLAMYDRDGLLEWARCVGGEQNGVIAKQLAFLPDGTAMVTGSTFIPRNQRTSADIYLAHIDQRGEFVWEKRFGGSANDQGNAIAVSPDETISVAGVFYQTVVFGEGEPNETRLTAQGNGGDIFIAQFNRRGALNWARRAGGEDIDHGTCIAASGQNIFAVGVFAQNAGFGINEPNETVLTSAGTEDIFIAAFIP